MKFKAIAITLAACWLSTTWGGGVGGFDGGSAFGKIGKGPILFQEDSTHVNPLYNRTICLTGDDYYRANIQRFVYERPGHDDSNYELVPDVIFQSRVSMQNKCFRRDNDGKCRKSEWVRFVQPRDRIIEVRNGGDDVVDRVQVRIPRCR